MALNAVDFSTALSIGIREACSANLALGFLYQQVLPEKSQITKPQLPGSFSQPSTRHIEQG